MDFLINYLQLMPFGLKINLPLVPQLAKVQEIQRLGTSTLENLIATK
jgi:hypothetical protein